MRLIDADALIERIKKTYCERCDNYNGIRCKACPNDDEIGDIDSAPTIDAVSVVHGEWMECSVKGEARYYCSVCDDWQTYGKTDYCPNCGAKMDGERKGE